MITEQDAWKIVKAYTNEVEDGGYISPLVYVLNELMKMQEKGKKDEGEDYDNEG